MSGGRVCEDPQNVVIKRQELPGTMTDMNQTTNARVRARNSANYRLQALTIGAAVLGVVGTGVFSYAAAMTYTGKPAADQQTSGDQGVVVDPNGGQTATGQSNNGQSNPAVQAPGTTNQGTTQAPRVKHSKHASVSTGGS